MRGSGPLTASGPAWRKIAELARIGPGTRVLDVGCGTGAFCAFAASRGALVAGADAAADRIASARERVPNGDFEVALMEQLPWTDGAFDVVTGFNSFQYALDVPAALAEAARVSRGLLAVCKYGNPRENEFFAFLAGAGARALQPRAAAGARRRRPRARAPTTCVRAACSPRR